MLGEREVAVEVKGTSRVDPSDFRSLRAFMEDNRPRRAVVVCNEPAPRVSEGIAVLPWREFLPASAAGGSSASGSGARGGTYNPAPCDAPSVARRFPMTHHRHNIRRRDFVRHGAVAGGAALLGLSRFPHALYAGTQKKTAQDMVTLGRTGLKVSRLAQGTGTNGFAGTSNQVKRALSRAGAPATEW